MTSESYNDDASGNNIEEENNSKANENHRLYTMRNSNIEVSFAQCYILFIGFMKACFYGNETIYRVVKRMK